MFDVNVFFTCIYMLSVINELFIIIINDTSLKDRYYTTVLMFALKSLADRPTFWLKLNHKHVETEILSVS